MQVKEESDIAVATKTEVKAELGMRMIQSHGWPFYCPLLGCGTNFTTISNQLAHLRVKHKVNTFPLDRSVGMMDPFCKAEQPKH